MSLKFKKKVILAIKETTYGVDPTPTGAANAMLTRDLEITPLEGDGVTRNLDRPTLGGDAEILTNTRVGLTFKVELAPSGTADVAPAYGPLLLGCGFAETITPTTGPVEYDPVSASFDSVGIYFSIDGSQHKVLGARGTLTIEIAAGQLPYLNFTFTGLYLAPTAAADPVPDWSAFQAPRPVNKANTPTFTLHAFAAVLESLNIELGNAVQYRNLVGQEVVEIGDREATGRAVIEAPALGTQDYFATAVGETLGVLQLIHGAGAGNIVQIDAPLVQIGRIAYQESQGIVMLNIPLRFTPSDGGDDELKITTK